MKTSSSLMRLVQSKKFLERSWRVIQENARTSSSPKVLADAQKFADDATTKINSLSTKLSKRSFVFGKAAGIPIAKINTDGTKQNKFRPLVIAPLEDRIVQRSVLLALSTVPKIQELSDTPYSFGGIKKKADTLSAVPAAVSAVLDAIGAGATHVAFADITAFFTKIPKRTVINAVADATNDSEFTAFFEKAIKVELSNLIELKEKAKLFPIEEIGVAQGNSLSPLLGNILLHQFDADMNKGDCRCIRYIDDFIILAPSAAAANAKMRQAKRMLTAFDMELSAEKSSKHPIPITEKFEFLGIEFNNGFLRPSKKAIEKLKDNLIAQIDESLKVMRNTEKGKVIPKRHSLIATLNRLDGIVRGWGKHYQFCNDENLFMNIDAHVKVIIKKFLDQYSEIKRKRDPKDASSLLGIDELGQQDRKSLTWPSRKAQAGSK